LFLHADYCRELWKKLNLAVLGWIFINATLGFASQPRTKAFYFTVG
jgi:hypothetical protein